MNSTEFDFGEEGSYSTDEMGHRYRYVLELENGIREFLTYPDAYRLVQKRAFSNPSDGQVVHRRPYQVRELGEVARHLEDELHNIWSFGVEVIFDRPVDLVSSQFGYQIVEQNLRDPETGKRRNQFFGNVIFPNTIKNRDVPGFRNLDYLSYVELVTDVEHQMRVMLRAQVSFLQRHRSEYCQTRGLPPVTVRNDHSRCSDFAGWSTNAVRTGISEGGGTDPLRSETA